MLTGDHIRDVGGAHVYPRAEARPAPFQMLDCTARCGWNVRVGRGTYARWDTGVIYSWPQVGNLFPAGAVSRRFPGCVVEGKLLNDRFFTDRDTVNSWSAHMWLETSNRTFSQLQPVRADRWPVSAGFGGERMNEQLVASGGEFRWVIDPAPKFWRVVLEVDAGDVEDPMATFGTLNVEALVLPLEVR